MLKEHTICKVQPCSIAEELELEPGDVLLSVNGHEIEDVFDYKYFTNEEYLTVLVRKGTGEEWELEIEKEYEDDLGIEFENGLMDEYIYLFYKLIPPPVLYFPAQTILHTL